MSVSTYLDQTSITDLLHRWLTRHVNQAGLAWLDEKRAQIAGGSAARVFFTAFSAVPRYTGKKDLELTPADLQVAATVRAGWFPAHWSVDQAARSLLALSLPQEDRSHYLRTLEQVFSTADMGELVALYQALPLLPFPEQLKSRAAEGLRSNVTAVFKSLPRLLKFCN